MCSKKFGRFILWIWYSELKSRERKKPRHPGEAFLFSADVALTAGPAPSYRLPAKPHVFYYLALRASNNYLVFTYLH